jgi:hypothetical protein
MDSDMGSRSRASSSATQSSKRARTDAEDGANEVGAGLPVTTPPRGIPHLYNNHFTVKLTYADTFNYSITPSGGGARQIFRANSIFDPDYTGVGHQPLFRDMWASQYNFYTVLACEYTMIFYHASKGQSDGAAGTYTKNNTACMVSTMPSTVLADLDVLDDTLVFPCTEMKNVQTQLLAPSDVITFKGTLTPGDFIVSAMDADNDRAWTAVGSNAAVDRYIAYGIQPLEKSGSTPESAVQVYVRLDYTVQFTEVNPGLRSVPS